AAPWVAVPAGVARVWTGEYDYRRVVCPNQAARNAAFARLRLNFRGVRWSVSVADYAAQLNAGWQTYVTIPQHHANCAYDGPHCLEPQNHGVLQSWTWW